MAETTPTHWEEPATHCCASCGEQSVPNETTWQQWQCACCGSWQDNVDATVEVVIVHDEEAPIEVRTIIDMLCDVYAVWLAEQGLNLGSADEHLDDETLTDAQRAWLRAFVQLWMRTARGER